VKVGNEIVIRLYRNEDLPRIMEIGNKAWENIYKMFRQCYGDELFKIRVPDENIDKGLQLENYCLSFPDCVLVCEEDGKVYGFITFKIDMDKKIGEIGNNAIDPECSIKGLGQQMYKAVFEQFIVKGMTFAKVSTGLDYAHEPARKAYERAGFNIKHEEVTYYKKLL
jgi:ribosomal protein S18 acetylase RimI-like enzyme